MSRPLIVYYSLSGETFAPGHETVRLEKGYTQRAAETIAEAVDGDLFKIETVKTYRPDHYKMIKEAKEELDMGIHPELKSMPEDLDQYELIYLGYPNWFNTIPNPVMTFLDEADLNGKTVVPFGTSGGGGLGSSIEKIKELAPQADIREGQHFLGHEVESMKEAIAQWATKVKQEVEN